MQDQFYGATQINGWDVVYKKAIDDDGTLLFPKKLSKEFLDSAQRTMGTYLFANQYMNEVIPDSAKTFKKEWIRYYSFIPRVRNTYITIDPALSEADTSDSTGIVVCHVDEEGNRYVSYAKRHRISPTELVSLVFELNEQFKPQAIGIEEVAYQKALLYFIDLEMRRRNKIIPITGVKAPTDKTKEMRILGLVPWFQWGRIMLAQGLHDLEKELLTFPRAAHDDVLDALAHVDQIASTPHERTKDVRPQPSSQDYEAWYRRQLAKGQKPERNQE